MDRLSDAELVARVLAANDRAAFAVLVRRHQAKVRALARKLACGDAALADDVAQEAFLRAYRGLHGYSGGARFSTWLCQIAYHAFVDQARKRPPVPTEESDAPVTNDGAAHAILRHDVERALACLSDGERGAIALTFGQDLTHDEAAKILGWPLGTLKTTVARALEKLERRMRPWRNTA